MGVPDGCRVPRRIIAVEEARLLARPPTQMKIAVATRNTEALTGHYGAARAFVVVEIDDDGVVLSREVREKPGRNEPGHGRRAAELVADCDVVIAGGMGLKAAEHLRAAGVEVVLTDVRDLDEGVRRFARGELPHLEERFHDAEGTR